MDAVDTAIRNAYEAIARLYRVSADTVVRRDDLRDQLLSMVRPACAWADDDILRRLINLRRKSLLPRLRDLN